MTQENPQHNETQQESYDAEWYEESPYDSYGWEFHKWPLIFAAILTLLFYAFVFFYINV